MLQSVDAIQEPFLFDWSCVSRALLARAEVGGFQLAHSFLSLVGGYSQQLGMRVVTTWSIQEDSRRYCDALNLRRVEVWAVACSLRSVWPVGPASCLGAIKALVASTSKLPSQSECAIISLRYARANTHCSLQMNFVCKNSCRTSKPKSVKLLHICIYFITFGMVTRTRTTKI